MPSVHLSQQQAWVDHDVAQCGYCQPGQIMTAVALVRRKQAVGQAVTDADLDAIRNICRCGTYARIREAIVAGEAAMGGEHTQTVAATDKHTQHQKRADAQKEKRNQQHAAGAVGSH